MTVMHYQEGQSGDGWNVFNGTLDIKRKSVQQGMSGNGDTLELSFKVHDCPICFGDEQFDDVHSDAILRALRLPKNLLKRYELTEAGHDVNRKHRDRCQFWVYYTKK